MSRLLIAIMIAAAALSAGAVSAEAACVVQRYTFRFDSIGPWSAFLAADSGRPCERGFRSGGQSVFKKLSILTDPANGRVDLVPGGRWRYTSRPGYKGPDAFSLQICGALRGRDGCANVNYTVTVK